MSMNTTPIISVRLSRHNTCYYNSNKCEGENFHIRNHHGVDLRRCKYHALKMVNEYTMVAARENLSVDILFLELIKQQLEEEG